MAKNQQLEHYLKMSGLSLQLSMHSYDIFLEKCPGVCLAPGPERQVYAMKLTLN